MPADSIPSSKLFVLSEITRIEAGELPSSLSPHTQKLMNSLHEMGVESFSLTPALRNHLLQLAEARSESRMKVRIDVVYGELFKWMLQIHFLEKGHLRARTVQKLIELSISQHSSQDSVSCRKSCAFCCHTPVSVTKSEVDQIYDYLEAQRISGAGEAAHPRPKGACTFLSRDSSCSIYDVRPIACRKLMAVSHPALCNSEEANSPSYLLFIEAELIASAFYNLESTSPGMMQTLLDFFGPSRAHILGRSTFGTISHEQPETHDI